MIQAHYFSIELPRMFALIVGLPLFPLEYKMQSDQRTSVNKTLTSQYDNEYLAMKAGDLRQRLDSLARANATVQPEIAAIENTLDRMETEPVMRVRWALYQLSYRQYVRICPPEELLGAFLGLRSRTYRLDKPNKEIWDPKKLDSIENQIISHPHDPQLRVEIDALAKAIDECGFRYTRDNDLKSELDRLALGWNVFVFCVILAVLAVFSIGKIDAQSPLEKIPILLFGVSGGLLSATLQQRRDRMYRHDMPTARVQLLFRAVFGAIAAVIVNMFLELRIVDFPVFRAGTQVTSGFPISALYIVGFVSGFTERIFFGAIEKVAPAHSGNKGREQEKK
jgi:hypothetical protein